MSLDLSFYGWTDSLPIPPDCVPARVSRVDRGAAELVTADGPQRAEFGARVRRDAAKDPVSLVCVGDWVALHVSPGGRREIAEILPRRTTLVRGGVRRDSRGGLSGDSQGQVLAANVDLAFVVEPAMHATDTADLGRVERLLALAWESGARPVILISKGDLLGDALPALLDDVAAVAPGVDVHGLSSLTGDGVELVRGYLTRGSTAVLLGASGAGKSTLVNALAGAEVMETQQIRAGDGRGRHTTTRREMILIPSGGLIIDTPGIRRVGLYAINDGVDRVFADIDELAEGCRFADCGHESEPGCAVLAAVASGEIPPRRLESWRKLLREAAWMASRADARLAVERARQWKIISKEMRRPGRSRP
ncbi:ribosome small subunit-dependent GTPase A [Rhizohabitans arisaemae]|uniref:ribosome small subunit-dependent GTPase A n=1 Tax=Rhizohabitans arisaemae TaxID=2720610 RepID=UPI0024B13A42|nr:ribosome small subunit-dependent GTPase A [Rhizohabitans arisaemae]